MGRSRTATHKEIAVIFRKVLEADYIKANLMMTTASLTNTLTDTMKIVQEIKAVSAAKVIPMSVADTIKSTNRIEAVPRATPFVIIVAMGVKEAKLQIWSEGTVEFQLMRLGTWDINLSPVARTVILHFTDVRTVTSVAVFVIVEGTSGVIAPCIGLESWIQRQCRASQVPYTMALTN